MDLIDGCCQTLESIAVIPLRMDRHHHRFYSPWPLQGNVAKDVYPGQSPANFYNPVPSRLPLPCQSILISVGHVLVDLQGLYTICF
jgi:hypothetical protein